MVNMSGLFWLAEAQMARPEPFLPKPHSKPRVERGGRPFDLFVTAGQVRAVPGARALLSNLPNVNWLPADRGYDADWFRKTLKDKGTGACIPGRKQRKESIKYNKRRYKRRNRIAIMFGRLKL